MAAKNLYKWIGLALAIGFITFVAAFGKTSERKYPDRKPVRFWHRWGGEWAVVVSKICDRFNESQDEYEVIPLSVPSSAADTKLMMGVIGGDPPDVMSMWNGAIPNMANSNLLTDLDTLMSPADSKYFHEESYPVIRDSGMFKGKTYGVTIGSDLYALYVDIDALEEVGLDVDNFPTTLEGVVEWGRKLDKFDEKGNQTRMGYVPTYYLYTSYSFGQGFYDWDKGELDLQNPSNLRSLDYMVKERKRVGFDQYNRFFAGLNTGSDTGGWPFITGHVPITLDGQWRVEELRKYAPNKRYRVIPLPPPAQGGRPEGATISGNFMVVPVSARNKSGAWEFIRFWAGFGENKEASAQAYNDGGWLPLSPKVVQTDTFQKWLNGNPQFGAFLDILDSENCRPMPPVPFLEFLNQQISRAEDRAVRGTMSAKASLEELQRTVDEERRKRRALGYRE